MKNIFPAVFFKKAWSVENRNVVWSVEFYKVVRVKHLGLS